MTVIPFPGSRQPSRPQPRRKRRRVVIALLVLAILIIGVVLIIRDRATTPVTAEARACQELSARYPRGNLAPPAVDLTRPAMGYNPFNHLGLKGTQEHIMAAASAMTKNGLQDAGYRYVNLDDGWQAASRDNQGNLTANTSRFGCGIESLAGYVHSHGFLFGIYTAASGQACGGAPGSAGHIGQDVRRFAAWGVDLIKLDWCGASFDANDVQGILAQWQAAIQVAGRPIYLMVNAGGAPVVLERAAPVANAFRVEGDICATWFVDRQTSDCPDRRYNFGVRQYLELDWNRLGQLVSPGHFADPDMLQIGNGLSLDEAQTQFTMWAMWSAPLIAGNNVPAMDGHDIASQVLLNRRIIALDQDGSPPATLITNAGGVQYWRKALIGGDAAIAAVNLTDRPAKVRITLESSGVQNPRTVQDLWSADHFGATSYYESTLRPHAVRILRFVAPARSG